MGSTICSLLRLPTTAEFIDGLLRARWYTRRAQTLLDLTKGKVLYFPSSHMSQLSFVLQPANGSPMSPIGTGLQRKGHRLYVIAQMETRAQVERGAGESSLWTYMSIASSPYGPWSELQLCNAWDGLPTSDMNFVAAFKPDGTLLAMNRWDVVEASDWRDMSTYEDMGRYLRGGLKYGAGEDPDIWQDGNGVWHMLTHNGNRGGHHPSDGTGDCGRHWFSETGEHGTFDSAPTAVEKKGGCAYNRTAVFEEDNGKLVTRLFYRRERPHIVLDRHGTMKALLTSVIDNPEINSQHNSDASYTLFQRIIM